MPTIYGHYNVYGPDLSWLGYGPASRARSRDKIILSLSPGRSAPHAAAVSPRHKPPAAQRPPPREKVKIPPLAAHHRSEIPNSKRSKLPAPAARSASAPAGHIASTSRAERPRHLQLRVADLALPRSVACPFPSFHLKSRLLAMLGWVGSAAALAAAAAENLGALVWRFFFIGGNSCGLGSLEVLVSIGAVSACSAVLRRKFDLRFDVRSRILGVEEGACVLVIFVPDWAVADESRPTAVTAISTR